MSLNCTFGSVVTWGGRSLVDFIVDREVVFKLIFILLFTTAAYDVVGCADACCILAYTAGRTSLRVELMRL